MNPDQLDRDMAIAHLTLHSWFPAYGTIVNRKHGQRQAMNSKLLIGGDRWFAISGEGNFTFQTGPRDLIKRYNEDTWGMWTDAELFAAINAMTSYGELVND